MHPSCNQADQRALRAFITCRIVGKFNSLTFSTGSPIRWKLVPISLCRPAKTSFTSDWPSFAWGLSTPLNRWYRWLIRIVLTTKQRKSSPDAYPAFRAHCIKSSALKHQRCIKSEKNHPRDCLGWSVAVNRMLAGQTIILFRVIPHSAIKSQVP